ncbi:MAG: hypothetical protein ABEJ07_00065 [Candidatus Nanohaloarchaea archaeon]
MNQTIQVIMVATVVLITGLLVAFMSSGSLTDLDDSTDRTENSKCQYQWQRINRDPNDDLTREDLTADCQTGNMDQSSQNQLLRQQFGGQLTGP